jgi:hypothetical protein
METRGCRIWRRCRATSCCVVPLAGGTRCRRRWNDRRMRFLWSGAADARDGGSIRSSRSKRSETSSLLFFVVEKGQCLLAVRCRPEDETAPSKNALLDLKKSSSHSRSPPSMVKQVVDEPVEQRWNGVPTMASRSTCSRRRSAAVASTSFPAPSRRSEPAPAACATRRPSAAT